ncbi:hypothetical protein EDB92DRAFT_1936121 [Lactarius akahatsu]|uniref:Protein-S-isoprenylcysteine O-methyltransferase n=1 Tax=Lactarius akahatsu TaxID=416441 RepID=A0AAD4QBF6_9AGAM|nr:hypothetical protein EDB92DRAFT_1936121 [Lactarius akahatsu]
MSLLVKIPLLVAATLGAWYALTPPQPPPGAQERVKSAGVERSFGSVVRLHAFVWKSTAASGALRLACYKTLGSLFTFELTLREDHRLVTSGPYAFVRHPSYSGVVLGVVGTLLVHFGPGSWWARTGWMGTFAGQVYALCWCVMEAYVLSSILCRTPTEDSFLRKQFGAEWDAWAARVQYRVIPYVF